jgi:hypothetical protein
VGLLRDLAWLRERGIAQSGDRTLLDLPEMGVAGEFQVMAVGPCPPIESGPGRMVTGVFRFSRGAVYDLLTANDAESRPPKTDAAPTAQ